MHTEAGLKAFIDACMTARRIVETMPKLPKGLKPRHIHVIDIIQQANTDKGRAQVSDISRQLQVTMPSVTRLVNELEQLGVVAKRPDAEDGRGVLLSLTELGQSYYQTYVTEYYADLGRRLEPITPEALAQAAEIIQRARGHMRGK